MAEPSAPAPRLILFDLGNVLLDWQPLRLYRQLFDTDAEARWFCAEVCTLDWHVAHDRGVPMAENARALIARYPDHADKIQAWRRRWLDMFEGYVDGMAGLMSDLIDRDIPLYGLSNIPDEVAAETFAAFPLLSNLRDVVISGAEKVVKPDPAIYQIALDRMGQPDSADVLFIDDSLKNIEAAAALGFQTHHFQTAAALRADLGRKKLL